MRNHCRLMLQAAAVWRMPAERRRQKRSGEDLMSQLNDVIERSVSAADAPFIVAQVGDANGVKWSGATGESAPGQKAAPDTVFRIFSMTKAVGSTAAMILMDRGKLSPDATVESILPEFGKIKLLESLGPDGPKMRAPRVKATVRHLATHTAGFAYEFWNAEMPKYMEATGLATI